MHPPPCIHINHTFLTEIKKMYTYFKSTIAVYGELLHSPSIGGLCGLSPQSLTAALSANVDAEGGIRIPLYPIPPPQTAAGGGAVGGANQKSPLTSRALVWYRYVHVVTWGHVNDQKC